MNFEALITQLGEEYLLLLGGLIIGIIFGAAAQQSRFCLRAATMEVAHGKPADRLAVVDGIFDALVGKAEALLGNVHPQHALKTNRWPSAPLALGVERLQLSDQGSPGRDGIDLGEESVTTGQLFLGGVLEVGEARLHGWGSLGGQAIIASGAG